MDLSPSRTGLLAQTLWRPPGSRAHCLLTCLDSSTTTGPTATRDLTRLADVAFPLTEKGRHPVACFRSSMIPPASPLSTLRCHPSRDRRQDSRPEWIRFSFSVGLSHPLQCAGLSRRSPSPKRPSKLHFFINLKPNAPGILPFNARSIHKPAICSRYRAFFSGPVSTGDIVVSPIRPRTAYFASLSSPQ